MTGPVERVPLTDEQIDDMERWALGEGRRILADALADLRASRARAVELLGAFQSASDSADEWCAAEEKVTVERDELQRRIGEALEWCHKANPRPDLNGDLFGDLIAALTGTEAADAGR